MAHKNEPAPILAAARNNVPAVQMSFGLGRREFIAALLGGAAAWPLAARAQQGDRVRRIGVHMPFDENDPEGKRRYSALTQALADLGWTVGRNVRMDLRWYGDDINRSRALAQELVGLQPDIIVARGTVATVAIAELEAVEHAINENFPQREVEEALAEAGVRLCASS